MLPIREFERRFRETLEALDDIRDRAEPSEALDEANADFEDALFVIECAQEDDEDAAEAFADAVEEMKDLCVEYRRLAETMPELIAETDRLEGLLAMAGTALETR